MRKKILWVTAALVLIAIPALIGLVALRGDDSSSSARRAAALIQAGTTGGFELQVDGLALPAGMVIDVESWSWGVANSQTFTTAGKAQFSELNIVKTVDETSPNAFTGTATGKHYPKAVLTCRKAGEKPVEYMVITMEDVFISAVQWSGSKGGGVPMENISLNFAKVSIEYIPEGGAGAERAGYDIRTATKF